MTHSLAGRRGFPLGAFLLTLLGNVLAIVVLAVAAAAGVVAGVLVFGGELLGLA